MAANDSMSLVFRLLSAAGDEEGMNAIPGMIKSSVVELSDVIQENLPLWFEKAKAAEPLTEERERTLTDHVNNTISMMQRFKTETRTCSPNRCGIILGIVMKMRCFQEQCMQAYDRAHRPPTLNIIGHMQRRAMADMRRAMETQMYALIQQYIDTALEEDAHTQTHNTQMENTPTQTEEGREREGWIDMHGGRGGGMTVDRCTN
eukprot:GDKI01045606.1.p1 GENE.GDKI01045606.1~~GDKI01045606.1.p1  ORF type:complete len:204 (-),score=48.76 GDKI01045606.1:204-815(-)